MVKIQKVIKAQEEQVRGHWGWSKGCQSLRPHFFSVGGWLEGSWGGCLWDGDGGVGWVDDRVGWRWLWCWVVEWVVVGMVVVVGWGWLVKLVVVLMVGAGLGGVLVRDGVGGV